jgi:L-malate glycosyltransferase
MSTIKKIAVLCDYRLMPERVGGMDRFFWLFDAECKALGHEIVWFFPNESRHEGYTNLTIIAANDKSMEQTFLHHGQFYDVVFTHFLELCTPFYQQVKKQKLVTKIVAVDHNPRPFAGYPLKKRIQKRVKGLLYSRYIDLFVGVSQYTVHEIIKDFGSHLERKSKVVYNGIAYEQFQKRTDRNLQKPTFLVACHLRYSKGIQDLIAAVALLPQSILADLKIDVYGEGDYQTILEGLIDHYKLHNNFVFKGSVPNLYAIYHQYDYLLQPTHMECFSLAILESLSANVPVITTPVGGNEEVVKNGINGYILPVQDPEAWSELLMKLYLGEEKITTITSDLIATEFSIERMVANYVGLISEK